MFLGVVLFLVNAQHNGHVLVFSRRRDNHFFSAAPGVGNRLGGIGEEAGGLDDDIDAIVFPGNSGGVAFRDYLNLLSIDDDSLFFRRHFTGIATVDAVPFQQVGVGPGIGEVIDRHHFNFVLMALAG